MSRVRTERLCPWSLTEKQRAQLWTGPLSVGPGPRDFLEVAGPLGVDRTPSSGRKIRSGFCPLGAGGGRDAQRRADGKQPGQDVSFIGAGVGGWWGGGWVGVGGVMESIGIDPR